MKKIQTVKVDDNQNIVLQDIDNTTITININDTHAIAKLIKEHASQFNEIHNLLQNSQEPILKQFADKIYNIQHVENANFDTQNSKVDIKHIEHATITKVEENRVTKYVKYGLLGVVVPILLAVLVYKYVSSKPFSMTVSVKETRLIPSLPFQNGTLTLLYGDKTDTLTISEEAIFKQLPANLKGEKAQLKFISKGYLSLDTTITLNESLVVPIQRDNSLGEIFGMVKDENNVPLANVQISVQDIVTQSDAMGNFKVAIPYAKQALEQRVKAFKEGFDLWEYTFPVVKGVETKIILKK